MGLFDRVEHKLERVVNGVFARAFKAEVQPVEIASAMRGAMDDRAAVVSHGRTVVPNAFTIELAPTDYERLHEYEDVLHTELVASVQEHAESQGYTPGGPVFVEFVEGDDLDTGVFRVLPTSNRTPRPSKRGPGPRPRNEMIMPQATAQADGPIGLAGSAAAAATAATAGTAAAASYGRVEPRVETPDDADDADVRAFDPEEHDQRMRQRARDLAAWPEDEPDPRRDYDEAGDDPWAAERFQHAPAPTRPSPEPTARVGSVAPDLRPAIRRPWLELGLDSYPLLSAITIIGRDAEADITLPDSGISRRHCELRVTHDGPHLITSIRDLGSTNGTFVNGERITTARLVEGDRITVGRSSLSVRLGER